jgi:hypothetical protein
MPSIRPCTEAIRGGDEFTGDATPFEVSTRQVAINKREKEVNFIMFISFDINYKIGQHAKL